MPDSTATNAASYTTPWDIILSVEEYERLTSDEQETESSDR